MPQSGRLQKSLQQTPENADTIETAHGFPIFKPEVSSAYE
uniref:Uncharacterized protein n=1 Tax=alpha proteobacterium U95 TaxID=649539 RepID=M4W6M1_9PROT|nr:hypothetical protein [alpha proteobacterium U95]